MICEKREKLYLGRAEQFLLRLGEFRIKESVPLASAVWNCGDPVAFCNRLQGAYESVSEGDVWGQSWESAWFHLTGTVPESWRGSEVYLHLDIDSEGLVFDSEGGVVCGITNGTVMTTKSFNRDMVPFVEKAEGGEDIEAWLEGACNPIMGIRPRELGDREDEMRFGSHTGVVKALRLAILNEEAIALWHDMTVLLSLFKALPEGSTRRLRVLKGISKAIDVFADDVDNAANSREVLKPLLACPAHATTPTACAVGHAHIDTAWLWPVKETIRKCARTFANQLMLIKRYPGYVFGASQPQHYQFTKDHYPDLYAEIKEAVKAGTWELQGGMWVEADCNLISGESMVRQFLYGKNFYMDEFGVDVRNLWIPDVFGYSGSMPQLMKRAGVDFFLTQKLSWSQFNRFPYTTFRWRGIDGTEVITHFPPEDTYNSQVTPKGMAKMEQNFMEKEVLDEAMCLFGMGDGGGGPREDAIERGLRMRDLEGSPKVTFDSAENFFDRLKEKNDELPLWNGELYLEYHRGTLTTQAKTKKFNRMLETALRNVEYLYSCLPLENYPQDEIDAVWKTVMINQFHDIIPGSSINCVYKTAEEEYAAAMKTCEALIGDCAEKLFEKQADAITLVNTTSVPGRFAAALPEGWSGAKLGDESIPAQKESCGAVVAEVMVPPQGSVTVIRDTCCSGSVALEELVLENGSVRYEFSSDGRLVRGFDKEAEREIIESGVEGNLFTLYEDRPLSWDAWDIDIFYEEQILEHARCMNVVSSESGPVRSLITFEFVIGSSTILQTVILNANSRRLDFKTTVDWREKHHMLRVSFPTTICTNKASFDIQYGFIERPNHRNVSWDMARFEVAGHKYADLSEDRYGVAILNDCKYGHKVLENVLDLNLLRSPTDPDPDADRGVQEFTYSLLPHVGRLVDSEVMAEATLLNNPPMILEGCRHNNLSVPAIVSGDGIELGALKKAEKEECHILRVVETEGRENTAIIKTRCADARIVETNLMEWTEECDFGKGSAEIRLKPFEIRTFKIIEG